MNEILPIHYYYGNNARYPSSVNFASSFLKEHSEKPLPNEIPLSVSEKKLIDGFLFALKQFGNDLGFDISERLPDHSSFHFLPHDAFLKKATSKGFSENCKGFSMIANGIVLKEENDLSMKANVKNHEIIHNILSSRIWLAMNSRGPIISQTASGFTCGNNLSFFLFNEATVEITNIEIMNRYWNTPDLKNIPKISSPYPFAILCVDHIFQRMARTRNETFSEVLKSFQKGMIKGDYSPLKSLNNIFGPDKTRLLSQMRILSLDDVTKFAQDFGLDDLTNKVKDYREDGTPITYLSEVSQQTMNL